MAPLRAALAHAVLGPRAARRRRRWTVYILMVESTDDILVFADGTAITFSE